MVIILNQFKNALVVVQSLVKIVDKVHIVTANDRTDNKEGSSTTKTIIFNFFTLPDLYDCVTPLLLL